MDEDSWRRLLRLIGDGFVVPIVGCRLLVDADGKSSVQAEVAHRLLSVYGDKVGDEQLPAFRELNEAVTRLLVSRVAKLQNLYADVDEAIRPP
jgi:hypothetical protein